MEYGLEHSDVLSRFDERQLAELYNGVGPDRWPTILRGVLSWLLEDVLESVLIHDADYVVGGDEDAFHEANEVLGANVRTLAKKKYGWWRPRRYFLKKLSYKLTEWTDEYGWEGWNKEQ